MTEEQDEHKLFADLEALTEEQIQVGLAAGVWSEQVRPLVQHYLFDLKLKRIEVVTEHLDEVHHAMKLVVDETIKSKTRATAAIIVAIGAMVAAMLAALVAFLAMRGFRVDTLW
jgi:hypothetical protein